MKIGREGRRCRAGWILLLTESSLSREGGKEGEDAFTVGVRCPRTRARSTEPCSFGPKRRRLQI
jgi:hypothetical protein